MVALASDWRNTMTILSRRQLLGGAAGSIALASGSELVVGNAATLKKDSNIQAPFRSMRDYVAALDDHGLLVRIPRVNQDRFEATALMYRLRDQHGMNGGPALLIDELKIDGEWIKGPLLINESGHMSAECIAIGLEPITGVVDKQAQFGSYRKARDHLEALVAKNNGVYPTIDTVKLLPENAPCKEVTLRGDQIDLTKFAFIKGNPGDAGRYINTGCVFTKHPKYGVNIGTYRCHLRGPREIGINSEPGQTGHRQLSQAKARGEKIAKVSIALTTDPYVWAVSGSKMSIGYGEPTDELTIAGGLAGRATEVVECETNDFMVPAWAEMIIEGEVPLDDLRPEGPYGEWFGYQGAKKNDVFWMRVTAVTHRRNPWLMNNFTGIQVGALKAPNAAGVIYRLRQKFPFIADYYYDTRSSGFTVVSIDKTQAGQGMDVIEYIGKSNFTTKVIVAVDSDVDVTNQEEVLMAMVARWQPPGNFKVWESVPILPLDQSAPEIGRGGKMAIDATRQLPEEGRDRPWPPMNRALLEQGAPFSIPEVDKKWETLIRDWQAKT
jgi:4-hydroxy-3-polyprenylbenzoate decarboxylase